MSRRAKKSNPPAKSTPTDKLSKIEQGSASLEVTTQQSFSGPIPPPAILAEYDSITSGLADRIVSMAEQESIHRHVIEKGALTANDRTAHFKSWSEIIGQCFGLIIGLASLGAGTYLAINGAEGAGGFIGGAGVIGLVTVFVIGRDGRRLKEKNK